MTAPHSIDPGRFLDEQLADPGSDLLRAMSTAFMNALMSAEADAICGAEYGQASPERANVRNGYRRREFDTRAGTLEVAIPKLRSGSYFPDWLLERRRRAEAALTSVVATCYLLGVSTRRMEKLVETLGITRLSKSQVSRMAADLDEQVEAFRTRPLDQGPYTFVAADALTMKVREGGPRRHRARPGRDRRERRRAPRDPRPASHLRRGRRRLADVLPRPGRPGPDRGPAGHLRRPQRPGRRDRRHPAGRGVATLPHPLRRQPDGCDAEGVLAVGEDPAPLGLRPARRRLRARPVRPARRGRPRQAAQGRRPPRASPRRPARVHRVPQGDLAADLVEQPQRAPQPRDPPPHRRRGHLPQPRRADPPRRRRPGRTTRRVDRRPPLPRPRRPEPLPTHRHHRRRRRQPRAQGGERPRNAGPHSLNKRRSRDDGLHHALGLDPLPALAGEEYKGEWAGSERPSLPGTPARERH